MSILAKLVIAAAIFVAGVATGIKWHAGQDAVAAQEAQQTRDKEAREQRESNEKAAAKHQTELKTINEELGEARETIARLSGRDCLSPDAVRVLNAVGRRGVRSPAGTPAGPAETAAADSGNRYSTDADLAGAIATCRASYAEVSSQLDRILDIEDRRHPSAPP